MKIQRTIETTATPAAVFAYLSDFTTTNEWDPGTVETVRVSGDGGLGTTYHNTSKFMGKQTELTYKVIEHRPDTLFALRGENKSIVAHDTIEITAATQGRQPATRVSYTADFALKGIGRLVAPLLSPAFKKLGDDAERGLRDALAKL